MKKKNLILVWLLILSVSVTTLAFNFELVSVKPRPRNEWLVVYNLAEKPNLRKIVPAETAEEAIQVFTKENYAEDLFIVSVSNEEYVLTIWILCDPCDPFGQNNS